MTLIETFARLAGRYPFLKRYPHPFMVHFTIVFMLSATCFALLYLATGVDSFETTAYHCLGAGILSMPLSILTGICTQRLNYVDEPEEMFAVEIRLSVVLLIISLAAFVWRTVDPEVLRKFSPASLGYLILLCALTPLVAIISFFGGILTFPLEGRERTGKVSGGGGQGS